MSSDAVLVDVSDHGRTRVITLHNPPVNTLQRPVRSQLLQALDRAEHDPLVQSVVVTSSLRLFSAGADLAEFDSGAGLAEPTLHGTIASFLDRMRTPVVAALEGRAVGGGLELALACHYRVATRTCLLGLPEVTLGFMPGAGGTQRLPRAIGLTDGLTALLTGRLRPAADFQGTALVDQVVDDDARSAALELAQRVAGPRRLRDISLAGSANQSILATTRTVLQRSKGATTARTSILDAVCAGLDDFDTGVRSESEHFSLLAGSTAARASRHLFFAERSARRTQAVPNPLAHAAVIGAGTMGRGIAVALRAAGIQVTVVDTDEGALAVALDDIAAETDRLVARRGSVVASPVPPLAGLTAISALPPVELVVEAVVEDIRVKKDVFAELDRVTPGGTVLASNTSGLDITEIAAATQRPTQVIGMHFFSPAQVMDLVEVVPGKRTSDVVLEACRSLAVRLGKVPVVATSTPGFIGNRIFDVYLREAYALLLDGAAPAEVDAATEAWGFRMGPFRVMDLIGNDVLAHARAGRPDATGVTWDIADRLVAGGDYGLKAGSGWYSYDGSRRPSVSKRALNAVYEERRARGLRSRQIDPQDIAERLAMALVNETAAVLGEGVAGSGGDVDLVFTRGYGFPAARGGPAFLADDLGLVNVVRVLDRLARDSSTWLDARRWEPHPLLEELAGRGGSLAAHGRKEI